MDRINVVSLSTAERDKETEELYNKCKPYLQEGYSLCGTVQYLKNLKHRSFMQTKWYKELKQRAKEDGYAGR